MQDGDDLVGSMILSRRAVRAEPGIRLPPRFTEVAEAIAIYHKSLTSVEDDLF